jgi:hypothetical protein
MPHAGLPGLVGLARRRFAMSVIAEVGRKSPVTRKKSADKSRVMGVCGERGKKKSITGNGITAAMPKPSGPKRLANRADDITLAPRSSRGAECEPQPKRKTGA